MRWQALVASHRAKRGVRRYDAVGSIAAPLDTGVGAFSGSPGEGSRTSSSRSAGKRPVRLRAPRRTPPRRPWQPKRGRSPSTVDPSRLLATGLLVMPVGERARRHGLDCWMEGGSPELLRVNRRAFGVTHRRRLRPLARVSVVGWSTWKRTQLVNNRSARSGTISIVQCCPCAHGCAALLQYSPQLTFTLQLKVTAPSEPARNLTQDLGETGRHGRGLLLQSCHRRESGRHQGGGASANPAPVASLAS